MSAVGGSIFAVTLAKSFSEHPTKIEASDWAFKDLLKAQSGASIFSRSAYVYVND